MVKNLKGGNRSKKGKNGGNDQSSRELQFKEEQEDYAVVESLLGNCRLSLKTLSDNKIIMGKIRGSLVKKRVIFFQKIWLFLGLYKQGWYCIGIFKGLWRR